MINNSLFKNTGYSNIPSIDSNQIAQYPARVEDIILSENHPDFKKMGGWSSIGMIRVQPQKQISTNKEIFHLWAIPYFPFLKQVPLIGEIVTIIDGLPTRSTTLIDETSILYYTSTLNIFNSPHINPLDENPKLGSEFKEKQNFNPLLPKEGDVYVEGRYGQSLRMGSHEGDTPIMILSNGYNASDKNTFNLEDEGKGSIIALFSKRKIKTEISSNNFKSFDEIIEPVTNNEKLDNNTITYKEDGEVFTDGILLPEVTVTAKRLNDPIVEENSTENIDELWVDENTFIQDDFSELEVVEFDLNEFQNYSELPNASLTPQSAVVYQRSDRVYPRINISTFTRYVGSVERDIPIYAKCLLEVIAYAEGTIGREQNGYNIVQNYQNTRYIIKGWTPNTQMGHPAVNMSFNTFSTQYRSISTACGRYQFLKNSWSAMGYYAFSKRNQDLAANKYVKDVLGSYYTKLGQYMQTIQGADSICRLLNNSKRITWDSLPYAGHPTISLEQFFQLYQLAYKVYGTVQ